MTLKMHGENLKLHLFM